jgi:hypothetical protein
VAWKEGRVIFRCQKTSWSTARRKPPSGKAVRGTPWPKRCAKAEFSMSERELPPRHSISRRRIRYTR